ncbi:MAG: hypothetical protein FWG87_08235 [Defluviitaleaceae bacterium]|nr:hypothetical protein [Defluviitaleaceae bacterium]
MSCNCGCNERHNECGCEGVRRNVYNCPGSQRVVKHQHVIKYHHDTINEYDVVHEHEYHTRDVVKEREVAKYNTEPPYRPNYCGNGCGCGNGNVEVDATIVRVDDGYRGVDNVAVVRARNECCGAMPMRPMNYLGRRW